jgi:hypothetical protein
VIAEHQAGLSAAMSKGDAYELALAYARRNIAAFPVALSWDPAKHDGAGGTNKVPRNKHGHNSATTDERELRRQFNKATLGPG